MKSPTPESIDRLPDNQQQALFLYAKARARHASAYRLAVTALLVFLVGLYLISFLTGAESAPTEPLYLAAGKFVGVAAVLMGGVTAAITSLIVRKARQEAVKSGLPHELIRLIAVAPARELLKRF